MNQRHVVKQLEKIAENTLPVVELERPTEVPMHRVDNGSNATWGGAFEQWDIPESTVWENLSLWVLNGPFGGPREIFLEIVGPGAGPSEYYREYIGRTRAAIGLETTFFSDSLSTFQEYDFLRAGTTYMQSIPLPRRRWFPGTLFKLYVTDLVGGEVVRYRLEYDQYKYDTVRL